MSRLVPSGLALLLSAGSFDPAEDVDVPLGATSLFLCIAFGLETQKRSSRAAHAESISKARSHH